MGLHSISVQLIFSPTKTGEFTPRITQAFDPEQFRIEMIAEDEINFIELIAQKGESGQDIDENELVERFLEIANLLEKLTEPIRDFIKNSEAHILFGGWSPNDDQITNLIIPSEFSLQSSLLNLNYEFCFNDYHF